MNAAAAVVAAVVAAAAVVVAAVGPGWTWPSREKRMLRADAFAPAGQPGSLE